MNTSLTRRAGLIGLIAGSALLLAPLTAGAATVGDELAVRQAAAVEDGTVVDGHLPGARAHQQGRVVDSAESSFRGSIRLTP